MPSPIAHAITGYALSQLPATRATCVIRQSLWPAVYGISVSVLPDFDFIPQLITGLRFHRGPSHSLLAALLASLVLSAIVYSLKRKLSYSRLFAFTLICYSAHLTMDAVTAGGEGMRLLWPLSDQYFRAPFSIFPPVRHSHGFWDISHLVFISVELVYSLVVLYGLSLIKPRDQRSENRPKSQL